MFVKCVLRLVACLLLAIPSAFGQEATGTYESLCPLYLLGLVHAREVHKELGLDAGQVKELEALFARVDAVWFPS